MFPGVSLLRIKKICIGNIVKGDWFLLSVRLIINLFIYLLFTITFIDFKQTVGGQTLLFIMMTHRWRLGFRSVDVRILSIE